ncbi:MAG: Type II secretion system protein [Parcubacteria group bacterium GW2011_GWA2_45_30]|nr:MAG: Type II secretion system protein [Parcubacteria group bacterium GW2011_GWA2_45_30]
MALDANSANRKRKLLVLFVTVCAVRGYMSVFEYKARTKEGELRSGVIDVSSKDAAIERLHQGNLVVVEIKEQKVSGAGFSLPFFRGKVPLKEVMVFSRQLSTLFEAQVPILDALKTLAGDTSFRPALRGAVSEILKDVTGGLALSQALSKHQNIFSNFYLNLVRAAEEAGKLQDTFTYLADYIERNYYLTSKVRNALMYPIVVLVAMLAVMAVMTVVVIPDLATIFKETNQPLPFYTEMIFAVSFFLRDWGIAVILVIVVAIFLFWRWAETPDGRVFFNRLEVHLPLFGEIFRKLYMARVADNLQTMIVAGIPILRALEITSEVVGNVIYKKALQDAMVSVKGGSTISAAFERVPEIPVMVVQMIRVGELTGRIDFILANLARFFRKEVDSMLDNLVTLIEPIMILVLGVMVAFLMLAIFVPLYNLVGAL